jgi:hypothetical protein
MPFSPTLNNCLVFSILPLKLLSALPDVYLLFVNTLLADTISYKAEQRHLNLEHRLLTKELRTLSNKKNKSTVETLLSTYKNIVKSNTNY